MIISGVLFDFDGTLTRPHAIDFGAIRAELGCPAGSHVLEFIDSIEDPARRMDAERILERHEMTAAAQAEPNDDAEHAVRKLRDMDVALGILTRNSRRAVRRSFQSFRQTTEDDFAVIVTRDDGLRPKPDPEGVLHAARELGVPLAEMLCVGDYIFDIQVARNAGCRSVFLRNGDSSRGADTQPHFFIDRLHELPDIVRLHRPLDPGKLPNELLGRFLDEFQVDDESIRICPGVGEDCAVVETGEASLIALKTDPITYATDEIGYYSVVVNANDIAVMGATPRWFLTTLLLPLGICAADVREIMRQLHAAALRLGITVCGGHSEITDAVTRPVIAGQMVGSLEGEAVDKRNMAPGDKILFTKRLAVEGVSIIAREMPDRLREAGVEEAVIKRAREFLHDPGISIIEEAAAALGAGGVTAMHDVTEGGLATALSELSSAAGRGIRVAADRVPVYPETDTICRAAGIDPRGLIGSGSLLVACRSDAARPVIEAIHAAGIEACCIGDVSDGPRGVVAFDSSTGAPAPWPRFEVDEIARLFV